MKRVIDSANVTFTIVVNNTVRTNIVKRCKSDTCFVCGLSVYQPCGECSETYDYLMPFNHDEKLLVEPIETYFNDICPLIHDVLRDVLPSELIECILEHVPISDTVPVTCYVTMDRDNRICHNHCRPNIWVEVKNDQLMAPVTIINIKRKKLI